jgi:hypothetical protein
MKVEKSEASFQIISSSCGEFGKLFAIFGEIFLRKVEFEIEYSFPKSFFPRMPEIQHKKKKSSYHILHESGHD